MQHKLKGKEILPNADIPCVFRINSRVQLRIGGKNYPSRIEDVGPEHIVVAAPIPRDTLTVTGIGHRVIVGVVFREAMHEFSCEIRKKALGRITTIILTNLQHIGEMDRRHYARTMDPVPILYRVVRVVGPWDAVGPWEDGVTDDIGGGGIRIARKDTTRLSVGDIVEVRIMLPDRVPINTICRVLRVRCTPGVGGPWGYWAAEFVHIYPKDRSDIIRFVEEQRAAIESKSK